MQKLLPPPLSHSSRLVISLLLILCSSPIFQNFPFHHTYVSHHFCIRFNSMLSNGQSTTQEFWWQGDAGKVDVCIGNEIDAYLNRVDVQQALHAQLIGVSTWSLCSELSSSSFFFFLNSFPLFSFSNLIILLFLFNFLHLMIYLIDIDFVYCSILDYDRTNLFVPTINIVGSLVRSGIRVLIFR